MIKENEMAMLTKNELRRLKSKRVHCTLGDLIDPRVQMERYVKRTNGPVRVFPMPKRNRYEADILRSIALNVGREVIELTPEQMEDYA